MAEISCETDFVSRNEVFLEAGSRIVDLAYERKLSSPDAEIEGLIAGLASVFKANIALKRLAYIEGGADERISSYIHGDGRIGVLVLAKAPTRGPRPSFTTWPGTLRPLSHSS